MHVVGSAMTDGNMSVRFSVLNSSRNSITGTLEGGGMQKMVRLSRFDKINDVIFWHRWLFFAVH